MSDALSRRSVSLSARLLDVLVYAVALTLVVSFSLGIVSFVAGAGLLGIKYGLFVIGFLTFGYGTFLLRPSKPEEWKAFKSKIDDESEEGTGESSQSGVRDKDAFDREATQFEETLDRIEFIRHLTVPPRDRFSKGFKIFLTSLLMLVVSFLLETAFGVVG